MPASSGYYTRRISPLMPVKPSVYFKRPGFLPFTPGAIKSNHLNSIFCNPVYRYPPHRYNSAIQHGVFEQFAQWSRDPAEWLRFHQSTILCDSQYIYTLPTRLWYQPDTRISCGNAVCVGTEEMENAGIFTSEFVVTAENCVSEYYDKTDTPCTDSAESAAWARSLTTIANERQKWAKEENIFDEIVARDTKQDWAIIKLKTPRRFMKIQEIENDKNVESLMQCSVNPIMDKFDKDLFGSFYGEPSEHIFLGLNQNVLHIFNDYKKDLEEKGIEFLWNKETSLLVPTVSQDANTKIYKTLLLGLGGHIGSGVSVKPGYIFGIFSTRFNENSEPHSPSTVIPLPCNQLKQIINSHYSL